jgi:hypothetical protein
MSLDVPTALLERAERGEVDDAAFVDVVRTSLPYAWQVISSVAVDLRGSTAEFADHAVPPPSEAQRGQLLRALPFAVDWNGISGFGWRSRTATGSPRSGRPLWTV